ncbi:C-type lectin TsL-like isoform X2 [Hypomesus transpacificus]|uniref:C-type lectin TsL-like isoform X2 n=1 Tax=Hypomesus transpacificus TaxID=137520 RepID=UPI001F07A462|nr:C-type lectin TsL-like isoform X2 [Hypomesus transpacificus]
MEDLENLVNLFASNQMLIRVWTGLYSTGTWSWSLVDSPDDREGQKEFRNWKDGKPSMTGEPPLCASFDSLTGSWEDQLCNTTLKFVCQGDTFVYVNEAMTWTRAKSYCRQQRTDLARVRSQTENQQIQEMLPGNTNVWIGLFKDPWKWSDGSKSSFTCWSDNQPDENGLIGECVASVIYTNMQCNDWTCDHTLPFFCYSVPVQQQVVRMSLTRENSGVDLEDPAVKEAILQQVQVKLREKGLTEDFQLRWRKQTDGKVFHKDEDEE